MKIQNFCTLILENLLVYGGDIQYQTLSNCKDIMTSLRIRDLNVIWMTHPKRYDKEDCRKATTSTIASQSLTGKVSPFDWEP